MKPRRTVREHRHRLDPRVYRGRCTVAFTACFKSRKPIFHDLKAAEVALHSLRLASSRSDCDVLAYCLMPDHVHIVLRGRAASSDTRAAFIRFKQATGYWLAKNVPGVGWQKDFYDHVLRREDDLRPALQYIVENPVRRGLVEGWREYPFTGSDVLNLEEVLSA